MNTKQYIFINKSQAPCRFGTQLQYFIIYLLFVSTLIILHVCTYVHVYIILPQKAQLWNSVK